MPNTPFIASPENVGDEYLALTPGAIGGANRMYGASPFTSAALTNIPLPATASIAAFKNAVLVLNGTLPLGTGNLNASIRKRQVGGAFVTLSTTTDLFTQIAFAHVSFKQVAGATTRDFTCAAGEQLYFTVDNTGGTLTTQPADLLLTVRAAVLR